MTITVSFSGETNADVRSAIAEYLGADVPAAPVEGDKKTAKGGKTAKTETAKEPEAAKPTHTIEEIRALGAQFDTDEMRDAAVEIIGPACGDNAKKSMSNILPANFDSVFDALTAKLKEFKASALND
jgi:hypothetical protein